MAITLFGFCLHAVMRQAFPSPGITTISSLSWPCTPHHGHLDTHYTFKCLIYTTREDMLRIVNVQLKILGEQGSVRNALIKI